MSGTPPYILHIPDIALEKIFSFLSYDEIAKNRIVSRRFNQVGCNMLSRGFLQVEKRHSAVYKKVKALLPRRESERRMHPLSRHCDILQAVETRISMLNMTYMKYIERNLLCFIPGKVLDELINVLNLVESDYTPPRTHQLLQELRDLSSMAMEHFDENILPKVREFKEEPEGRRLILPFPNVAPLSYRNEPKAPLIQHLVHVEMHKIKKQYKTYKNHITYLTQNTQKIFQKLRKHNLRIKAQTVIIRDQERKIQEQQTKLQEQESCLVDIKKHMDEWDQKYKDLTAELVRAKDEILSQQSPKEQTLSSSKVRLFRSSIRPRRARIVMPKLNIEMDRKRKSTNLLPEIPLKLSKNLDEQQTSIVSDKNENFLEPDKNDKRDLLRYRLIRGPTSRKRRFYADIDLK